MYSLFKKGLVAVDINGNTIKLDAEKLKTEEQKKTEILNDKIVKILSSVEYCSSKDILIRLNIGWSDAKMKKFLETMSQVEKNKIKNRVYYSLKNSKSKNLTLDFE